MYCSAVSWVVHPSVFTSILASTQTGAFVTTLGPQYKARWIKNLSITLGLAPTTAHSKSKGLILTGFSLLVAICPVFTAVTHVDTMPPRFFSSYSSPFWTISFKVQALISTRK